MKTPSGGLRRWGSALVVSLALAAPMAAQRAGDALPTGPWGGEGILFLVSASSASAELNCAHGQTNGPVILGDKREFKSPGWLVSEEGTGPDAERESATYVGRLRGDVLTLSVRFGSAGKEHGPFELRQGGGARVAKCP
jgi:hypothetical protein